MDENTLILSDENQQELSETEEYSSVFQKAAEATEIAITVGKLTLIQKKILNIFLKYAKPHLMEREEHSMLLKELLQVLNFDSNDHTPVLSALENLPKVTVVWNYLGKDHRANKDFGAGGILSQVELIRGVITYSYPAKIRAMLHAPKKFSVVDIKLQNEFSSNYSLTLYEVLEKYRGLTEVFPIEKFKEVLGIDANNKTYVEFKNFNRKILKPALQELNAISDLYVEPHFHKSGRIIVGLSFHIVKNQAPDLGLPIPEYKNSVLYEELLKFGCNERQAEVIITTYPQDYIEGNLNIVIHKIKAGEMRSKNGTIQYLMAALAADYRPKAIENEKRKRDIEKRDNEWKKTVETFEDIKNKYVKSYVLKAREIYQSQSEENRDVLMEDFIASIGTKDPLILQQQRKSGLKSGLVKTAFYNFIGHLYKIPYSESDFFEYVLAQNHNPEAFKVLMEKEPIRRWFHNDTK